MNTESPPAKIGIFAGFSFDVPFRERMRLIREAGFVSTALWWEERHPEGRRLRHLAPDAAREAGLDIDHIHVPYHNCTDLWSDSQVDRDSTVEQHNVWIRDCARHGVPRLVMHVAAGPGTPPPNAHGVDSLRRMLESAEEQGITLAIENTRRPEHIGFLLSAIDSPALGLCFDTSHDRLYAETPDSLLHVHGGRLVTTHVSDTDGRRDLHLIPGEGVCEYGLLAGRFSAGEANLILEVRQRNGDESPRDYLARAFGAATRLQGGVNCEARRG